MIQDHPLLLGVAVLSTAFALSTSGLVCLAFCAGGLIATAALIVHVRFLA